VTIGRIVLEGGHNMVKYVALIRLKPGYDPDETWALWRTKHTVWAKKALLPELKQYSINRVVATLTDSDIFGFAEMLFDDVDSCKRAFKRLLTPPPDEVLPRFQVERIIMEFKEVPLG